MRAIYKVHRLHGSLPIDGNWNKPQWQNIKAIPVENLLGPTPAFVPKVQAKMLYDDENVYVIFLVHDRFVRAVATDYNGSVWHDSCVEFFFAPNPEEPMKYFNLEINCGGTPLMHYNLIPRQKYEKVDIEDMKKIEIAHSLPKIVEPEIVEPTTWTLEYRLPLRVIEKYSKISRPEPGVTWQANFYKIGEKTSNPHYLTWSVIENGKIDYHQPQFFGTLEFVE